MGMLPRLPKTYAFKGGAARLALQSVLGGKREMSAPRDLDVARIGGFASPLDKKVAARFMAEDFRHGDGVEVVKSLQHYFSSRDLTINEAIILAGQLVCTRRALSDCLMGILRLTDHLHRQSASERNKILIKALRIQAEQKVLSGRTWRLVEAAALKQVNPFHIAVHLGRALQCGKNAAEDFVRALMEAGVLSINPAGGLLEKALEDLRLLGLNGSLCQEISRLIAPDFSRAAAKPLIINQRLKAL